MSAAETPSSQPVTFCEECGAANRTGARFCRNCGRPLDAPLSPAEQVEVPSPWAWDGSEVLPDQPAPPAQLTTATLGRPGATVPGRPGTHAPGPAATPATPTRPQIDPLDLAPPFIARGLRGIRWMFGTGTGRLLAVVLTVSLGICGFFAAANPVPGLFSQPEDAVKTLFAALAKRDLSGVCGGNLCDANALTSGYTPPDGLVIGKVTYGVPGVEAANPDKNHATVAVQYRISGKMHQGTVEVLRSGGDAHAWRPAEDPTLELDVVSTSVSQALLANVLIQPEQKAGDYTMKLFPGAYTVSVQLPADQAALFTASPPVTVVAAGDTGKQTVTLSTQVQPAALDAVNQQVRARMDECAQRTEIEVHIFNHPDDCPFMSDHQYTTTRNVRWKIDKYPELELVADRGTVTVTTKTPGQATLTLEYTLQVLEPRQWYPVTEPHPIQVGGTVKVDNGTIKWAQG
jgi:hypothetical protein